LKEKSNFDCIFWNEVCTVYQVRPLQCRTFPFWDYVLCSPQAWKTAGESCPGINKGGVHSREKIEEAVRLMEEEPVIEREARN
jgi:Fe-S-cluster containining protein